MVRLNHYGWSVAKISEYKDKSPHTVRASLQRWQNQGLKGLREGGNRGRKRRWLEEDLEHLETCLEQDQRTYNAVQLAEKLAVERGVTLSAARLRKLLKKRGGVGKGQDRTRHSQPIHPEPKLKAAKQADLDWLLWAHSVEEICLKFLDESGFCLWSPVSYTYALRRNPKSVRADKTMRQKIKYFRTSRSQPQF